MRLRPLLHPAALAAAGLAFGAGPPYWACAAAAALGGLAAAVPRIGRFLLPGAWLLSAAALALLPPLDMAWTTALLLAALVPALVAGLHRPLPGAPPPGLLGAGVLAAVALAVSFLAWAAPLAALEKDVAVQDPLTPAGAALRIAAAALALSAVASAAGWLLGRLPRRGAKEQAQATDS